MNSIYVTLLTSIFLLVPFSSMADADPPTVEERRSRPVLIDLHRGAWEFAPPNTMAAFRAALAWGGDVLEVDVRRTADGRLVCFHDETVDGDLDGVGLVGELTYEQIGQMPFAPRFPESWRSQPVPLFAEVLAFARQHGLLFHLDIKVPNIDAEVARMLTEAAYWQGVATINDYNSEAIRTDPRYRPLPVKGGLLENHLDCEFDQVAALIQRPGQWLIVDDPRLAATWLGRLPQPLVSMEEQQPAAADGSPPVSKETPGKLLDALKSEAGDVPPEERRPIALRRTRAALELGLLETDAPKTLAALRHLLRHPTVDSDYRYHAMDAAMAARSLGRLADTAAVADLQQTLGSNHGNRVAAQLVEKGWKPEQVWWLDYRLYRECLFALAAIGTPRTIAFLEDVVAGDAPVFEFALPHLQSLAAEALVRYQYPLDRVVPWLAHDDAQVRRRAFLTILAHPEVATTRILRRQIQMWIRSGDQHDAIALAVSAAPFLRDSQCIPAAARSFSHPRIRAALEFALREREE